MQKSLLFLIFLAAQISAHAQSQMAIWTFPSVSSASTVAQNATTEILAGTPNVQQFYQSIANSGTAGRAYTDFNSVSQPANNALLWNDVKGNGFDAELILKMNTTGWSGISMRFDYKSRSADAFDFEYSLDNGNSWFLVHLQTSITDGYSWQSKTLNLSALSDINDAPNVRFRLSHFDDTGNDEFAIDNIEFTGTQIAETAGRPYVYVDTARTTDFIHLKRSVHGNLSGVINDPIDPGYTKGIYFLLRDSNTPLTSLTFTRSSSNTTVVPSANLVITSINDSIKKLTILPATAGYANITLTVSDGTLSSTYIVYYAASAAAIYPSVTNFHTGFGDASTSLDAGGDYILVADDEGNCLHLVHKDSSGYLQKSFDMGTPMGLTHEGDFESSFRKGNRAFWMGSQGNSVNGNIRPDRHKFFATDITGSGANTNLTYVGSFDIRASLISWGDGNGYDFTSSAADGEVPEQIDGLNVEGMALGPDSASIYIAFRAPLVPLSGPSARTKALICPVMNYETWFNNGNPIGNPTYGAPIELNLGGRGIRSIERNIDGKYIIVAGDYATGNVAPALFEWSGVATDAPVLLTADLTGLNPEGIVSIPAMFTNGSPVELLSDDGSQVRYGDGIETKFLPNGELKKFRTQLAPTTGGTVCTVAANANTDQNICAGDAATLAGSYSGGATSATWSGGTGNYSPNASTLNATYTPSAAEIAAGIVTLTLTTNDPAGSCSAAHDPMTIHIYNGTSSTVSANACASYTLNANTYTASGTYTQVIPNSLGCDSTITLNLVIHNASATTLLQAACDSYTLNANTYTTSGTYTQTLTNSVGCDSTITLNLTINNSTSSTLTPTACNSYTLNASTYTTSGTYTQVIPNSTGCDSTITLNLTINTVDVSVNSTNTPTLTANASGAVYQWLNCSLGYIVIAGATSQSFIVPQNGIYAVSVTQNGCTDTSACVQVTNVGIASAETPQSFEVFPNPGDGLFMIRLNTTDAVEIIVYDAIGQIVCTQRTMSGAQQPVRIESAGVYMIVVVDSEGRRSTQRVVVNR